MSVDHDSIKANDLLVEGKRLHDAGKYGEAVASYDKAIEIKSEFVDVWNSKGYALAELEKYEEAIASYDKAIEIDPKSLRAWRRKGLALAELGRYDDAIASFDKAIEIDPKHGFAWRRKGDSLAKLGRYDDAIAPFDKAIEIDPKDGLACLLKGMVLEKLGRYDDAIASFDKAIEIDPKDGLAWRNKGTVLQKLERYDDALACYDKVIEMHPGDKITWDNNRIALAKLGSPEYDPRCAGCDHYPWTHVFVSGRGYDDGEPRWMWNNKFTGIHGCKCGCHDPPTYGKIMRFSLKRKDGKSKHVMHVKKLAVCPFCKRSEFEDSVFDKINDRDTSSGLRHEMLAEDLKATGAPERDSYDFDYNDLYESGRYESKETLLTPCTGNHKHEWYRCACGRKVCKISFRNYFGYEISDDLFDNDFVDRSHYSERTKALLDKDERGYGDKRPPFAPKSAEVPIYATMATIEKVWGKLPRLRTSTTFNRGGWYHPSNFPSEGENEETRPAPRRIFDMLDATISTEEIHNRYLEAKKGHEEWLEVQFLEEVSGIGDATVEKLLKKFRKADKVFSATAEEIAKAPGISEGRARQIRKKLDDHPKEYGQEYRDKKRKEPFTYRDSRNPGYTYSSESFESTADSKS